MPVSFGPFIAGIALSQRVRKYTKANNLPKLEKTYTNLFYFSIGFLALDTLYKSEHFLNWAWHIFLLGMIVYSLLQKELQPLRFLIMSTLPFAVICLISDIIEAVSKSFYDKAENYLDLASFAGFIWIASVLFLQNRQMKTAEKERIKRQHEDEINRAIAIRKVELEGLVAERTAEITLQKEDLQHALTELRSTQTQLIQSEKMASLGELTAGIAHEIQNPLNFVNNFSELNSELIAEMKAEIEKGNFEEVKTIAKDIEENEQKIVHHGKRADAIVKGMLQHSRASSAVKEPADINALADEYLRLSYHGLRAKDKSFNATMKTDFDETLGKINVIPQDIGRVILNLLTNAFYAVNEKKKSLLAANESKDGYQPTVSVSTKKLGNKVEISVGDNADGIPQKVLDKIFQPFFTTKPTGEGTGLGLSLSYDIVTKGHGGELKVETKEGQGTTFIIILPA